MFYQKNKQTNKRKEWQEETKKQQKRTKKRKNTHFINPNCTASLKLVLPSPGVAHYRFISSVWPRITFEDQSALLRCKSGLAQQEKETQTNGVRGQRSMGRKLKIRKPLIISLSTLEPTVLISNRFTVEILTRRTYDSGCTVLCNFKISWKLNRVYN